MEVNLDLSLVRVPITISELLTDVSKTKEKSRKISKVNDYIQRLEEEKRKIDAFKRELPLSMFLVKSAIGKLKEVMQCTEVQEQPEIADFMTVTGNREEGGRVETVNDLSDKKEWMSSVQLWSSDIDFYDQKQDSLSEQKLRTKENDQSVREKPIQLCNYRSRDGEFVPFKEHIDLAISEQKEFSQASDLSLVIPSAKLDSCNSKKNDEQPKSLIKNQDKQQQEQRRKFRKQRRSWSAELHRLFVDVLNHLGGSQVATPKQIRQLMRVDGLTNDEIKSHLQKYRIYLQRCANFGADPEKHPWMANDLFGDNSNPGVLRRNSPQSPLPSRSVKDISTTGGIGIGAEEDDRSDGHSWNGKVYLPG